LKVCRANAACFPVKVRPECEHAFYRYAWNRQDHPVTVEIWDNDNIYMKPHYITPLYRMPLFKSLGYPDHLCPVCEDTEKNIILAWLKEAP
jgi:hypothetical protein